MGLMQMASGLGSAAAFLLGGYIVGPLGWQGGYWIMTISAAASTCVTFAFLPAAARSAEHAFDWLGAALWIGAVGGVGSLISLLTQRISALLVVLGSVGAVITAICVTLFCWREFRSPRHLFAWPLLRRDSFRYGVLASFLVQTSRGGLLFVLPFLLISGEGYSAQATGLAVVGLPLAEVTMALVSGWWADRRGPGEPAMAGTGMAVISLGLFAGLSAWGSAMGIAVLVVLTGLGFGLFYSANNSSAMGSVTGPSEAGSASGTLATAISGGMVFGPALAGGLIALNVKHLSGATALQAGGQIAVAFMAGLSLVACLFLLRAASRRTEQPPTSAHGRP